MYIYLPISIIYLSIYILLVLSLSVENLNWYRFIWQIKGQLLPKKLMTKNNGLGRLCTNRYKDHLKTRSPALQADSLPAEQQEKPKNSGVSKESACQCRRCRFDTWVGNIPRRRKWQPIPVFLPGKSHGQKSLVGYSLWSRKQLDMTEYITTPSRDRRGGQPFRVFSCLGM